MIGKFFNLFKFDEKEKQTKAVFDWLGGVASQKDLILVEQEGKREYYRFRFPLKIGDKPERTENQENKSPAFFIRASVGQMDFNEEEWQPIFRSPELEVYESKKKFEGKQPPLRWGLGKEDRKTALKIVRKSIEIFLKEKTIPEIADLNLSLSRSFFMKTDLDVALWTNGVLRGSWVVENSYLATGIIEAAVSACRDKRFKPLELDELKNTKIEITLFSELKIPLSKKLIDKEEIFYDKGYLLKKGEKQGWFLPEVFNVLLFKNLKELLLRLGTEKAFLSPEEVFDKRAEFFIFEVDDFIESKKQRDALVLDGPVAVSARKNKTIKESALAAADWLLGRQEPDGNFVPIINPLTDKTSQLDWPRSIFTGWSLIELGKTVNSQKYIEAGRKNFSYGKKYILDEQVLKNFGEECLALAYLGQEALSLGYPPEALLCGKMILEKEGRLKFEPILFSQIGSFFSELSKTNKNFLAPALRFGEKTRIVFDEKLRQKQPMPLAVWAELVNLHLKLFKIQNDGFHLQAARKVMDWLLSNQLDNGSFKAKNGSKINLVYTRGTAKIAEVLAEILALENQIDTVFDTAYYKTCFEKSINWLIAMQYSPENSFFIPNENLDSAIGGFRHDYFNKEAWIDSAGHFLLAVSRFLNSQN
ncbi:MAG: AMMECR1 domain-containing protein [Candidatus Portnoybacteria bacterium]|nr:AMMECR1 domain-containing protein [Candidatus Portnoybacteria bacterium]